jgi:hypothetical protein
VSYIALNVHAPTEGKTDEVKDSFYEKLEHGVMWIGLVRLRIGTGGELL